MLETYAQRAQECRVQAQALRASARWFPWLRAGFFLGGLVVVIRVWAGELPAGWMWPAAGLFLAFLVAALRHQSLIRQIQDAELMAKVNERAYKRLRDEWGSFSERGDEFNDPEHPYSHDLDLFGQGSLFQMLHATTTWYGRQTLARWLLSRAEPEVLRTRQAQVKDLSARLSLRQEIEREGLRSEAEAQRADPTSFLAWAEAPPVLLQKRWLQVAAIIFPLWLLVAGSIWMVKVLPPWLAGVENLHKFVPFSAWWWLSPWLLVLLLFARYVKRCQAIFRQVIFHQHAFSQYRALFARIDAEPAEGTPLADLQQRLRASGWAPHQAMRRLQLWIDLAEVRQSPIMHLPLNLLGLWDLHCLFGMERWKRAVGREVRGWFEEIGVFEALSSLAGLAHDHPEYVFPTFVDAETGDLCFDAEALGHPLLPAQSRVSNDVTLSRTQPLLVITGSNMSGKSTMLRAIGLNAVMAYAGGIVCAKRLRLSMMQVGTSMRISDSLEHGISYFMAELKRIHRIVSLQDVQDVPLLFLLDEILHGTNTRERRIAAIGIISLLLQRADAIGCVTTHDLELAELCKRFGKAVQFAYFTDQIEDDQMRFDYRLRDGICPTTNALKLMRIVGIPLPEDESERC